MSNCTVEFWADKDQGGYHKTYTDPVSKSNLSNETWDGHDHHHMDDTIGSLTTGSQAWVQLYSQTNYSGRSVLVGPNQTVNMEDLMSEGKNMDDTIESFVLYNAQPDVDPSVIIANFLALYPESDHSQYTLNNLWNSRYYSQDSEYRAYDPIISVNDGVVSFEVDFDHVITDNSDDHATLTFSMDLQGNFKNQIQVNYNMASATHIPKWLISIADLAVDGIAELASSVLDGVDIAITDGLGIVGVVGIDEIVELASQTVTFCIDHVNAVLKFMFVIQDDGGTMNFPAVVSHGIARIVYAYYQEQFGDDTVSSINFDSSAFFNALGGDNGDILKNTQNSNFENNSFQYRAYAPDVSYFYGTGGALISLKIDAETDGEKDDHIVLQMTFDPAGRLFFIVGTVDLFLDDQIDGYLAPTSGMLTIDGNGQMIQIITDDNGQSTSANLNYDSLEDAYADLISTSMNNTASSFGFQLTDEQIHLVDASSQVISAIETAVTQGLPS